MHRTAAGDALVTIETEQEHVASPVRAHDARAEIVRLMAELHHLVSRDAGSGRDAVEEALPAAAQLQVVTANVDACNPSRRPGIATELVTMSDQRARTRRDATERILAYTSDSTMRRLTESDPR
jgi:hypothetical protein